MKYLIISMVICVLLTIVTLSYGQDGCDDVMCQQYCEYGYKKNAKGCDICECNEQTEIRDGQCPQIDSDVMGSCDEACKHDGACPANQKCCSNGCGHVCMDIVRDGYCPISETIGSSTGICVEMCSVDSDCADNTTKCCQNACDGHACVQPDQEKRGTCPTGLLAEDTLGLCSELCARDADCDALQKCCSNGCGHVCITPVDLPEVHSGSCPASQQGGMVGTCANFCENDAMCGSTQKCCPNACNGYSCIDAIDVPVECPEVMCLRWCAYGYKTDTNGCDICDCAEPTEIHTGECPVESSESTDDVGVCVEACEHDGDCEDNEKCCSNGCGHVCTESISPDPEGCPINAFPEGELGVCADLCSTNENCTSGEICCSNGCGHACTNPVTVHEGTCPTGELQLGWSGVCVEMCNNDGICATNQKCCSNGCGHVCITVEKPPESCPDVVCQVFCVYGNKKDNNGCIICECQEPSEAGVERPGECPVGLLPEGTSGICAEDCTTDEDCMNTKQKCCSNGCGHVCTEGLNMEPPCPPFVCTRYCENGFQTDDNGCDVCTCKEEKDCGTIKCSMHCPYGYKEDKVGCNVCECEQKPSKCPEVTCEIFCINGFQRDSEGCEICACTSEVSALFVKGGSCPAVTDTPGSCADLCDIDDECTGGDKCCYNGCGHTCMATDGGANIMCSPVMLLVLTFVSILATLI